MSSITLVSSLFIHLSAAFEKSLSGGKRYLPNVQPAPDPHVNCLSYYTHILYLNKYSICMQRHRLMYNLNQNSTESLQATSKASHYQPLNKEQSFEMSNSVYIVSVIESPVFFHVCF